VATVKQKSKKTGNREQGTGNNVLEIELKNVEKANLVLEI